MCVLVRIEQWSVSVVSAAGVCAGIYGLLLQRGKIGAALVGIYSSGAAERNRLYCVFIDPAGPVDWALAETAISTGVGACVAKTADSSNRKNEKKLGEKSSVYIIYMFKRSIKGVI